jgi:hypothetical protein
MTEPSSLPLASTLPSPLKMRCVTAASCPFSGETGGVKGVCVDATVGGSEVVVAGATVVVGG